MASGRVERYRTFAARCRRMATEALDPQARAHFAAAASEWHRLAESVLKYAFGDRHAAPAADHADAAAMLGEDHRLFQEARSRARAAGQHNPGDRQIADQLDKLDEVHETAERFVAS